MTDKSKQLSASVKLINDKLNFSGIVEGNSPISIDYIPPLGDNLGYTSLELLLLSLSSCVGSAMLLFLRRMQKTISEFEITAKGVRNEGHPTGFKSILMNIHIKSPDVNEADLKKVIELAEDKYCPVWAMIKGNVIIDFEYEIIQG
ncbi:MAG: OsmC family protein [Bacteroidales bacterium]|nr:OsmC family protein [Bacteroidales bacterium]